MKKLTRTLLAAFALPLLLGVGTLTLTPATANADDINITTGPQVSKGDNTPSELFGDNGVFKTITNVLLFLIGAISVIMLIIGGIRYTTSNGDSSAVQGAKNTILYSVVGIIVAILAFAVVNFVVTAFTSGS